MFKNQKSESSSSAHLRRKYLHLQLEQRKQNKEKGTGSRISVDRPRAFARSLHISWLQPLKKIGILLGMVVALVGILYVMFFSPFLEVTRVQVDKTGGSLTAARLQPFIDNLKGRNILFINNDRVARDIEASFPNEVLLVKAKKSFPQRMILKIDEYPAVLNFHVKTPEVEQKLVLNQIGFIIGENNDLPDIPVLVLESDKPLPIVQGSVLAQEKLTPLVTAYTKFQELFGMRIVSGEWQKIAREVHLKTEKNFTVWIDLTQDVEKQLLKLKRALPKLDIYTESLEYIDLRIAGAENEKIIFKRRK